MHGRSGRSFTRSSERTAAWKDVERQPRSGWRLINFVIDLLEEKKLGFIGGTASGKEFIGKPVSDPLPSFGPCTDWENGDEICPQTSTLSEFIDCTPYGLIEQTGAAWPHYTCKLPPLNQNRSISSRRVEWQASYPPSSPMDSSDQMEGGPRGSMRKKEIIKEPASSRVLNFMYMCIEISDCLYDKTMTEVACLFWCSIYVLPLCKWLVRPCIYSARMLWLASIRFCFLSAFLFCFRSLAWDWWKNWTRNKELNWSSLTSTLDCN